MESLGSGKYCKVTRHDIKSGIFDLPKLPYYVSDGEEDDNLQGNIPHEGNLQIEVHRPAPIPEPFQPLELIFTQFEQSADKVRSIMALSDEGNLLLKDDIIDLPEKLSNVEVIEYLIKKGPTILAAIIKNRAQGAGGSVLTGRERSRKILRKLADEIEVLLPGNNADDLGDWRDRSQWQRQLSALVSELVMVEGGCSSEVRDAGLFVLTTFQYRELLKLMAQEM